MPRVLLLLPLLLAAAAAPRDSLVIPRRPDPPPSVDGNLGEWQTCPGVRVLDDRVHATFGAAQWAGPDDLSAHVWFGWDAGNLYVAADVRDDTVDQAQRGGRFYLGDHLELFLRTRPGAPADRFAAGDWQLGFSPGNFGQSGDPLADIAPEAVVFWPPDASIEGMRVAALRTEAGYTLEASIPLAALGLKPQVGQALALELALSDSDGKDAGQQAMLTLNPAPWKLRDPGRLLAAHFGDVEGKLPPGATAGEGIPVFAEARVEPGKDATWRVAVPDPAAVPGGRDAVLAVKARLESAKLAGGTGALQVWLDGTLLDGDRLTNRPRTMMRESGGALPGYSASTGAFVFYSPDYQQGLSGGTPYSIVEGAMYALEFRVGDLLKPGGNEVRIRHGQTKVANVLALADARLAAPTRVIAEAAEPEVAPEGPVPTIVPRKEFRVPYTAAVAPGGGIRVRVGERDLLIGSRFSQEGGMWNALGETAEGFAEARAEGTTVTARARDYTLARAVAARDELIEVRDTFTNTCGRDIALQMRHEFAALEVKALRLGGLNVPARSGSSDDSANPTVFVDLGGAGLGLMAFDDVFRVHSAAYCLAGRAGLADNQFVLGAGKTHTAVWWILPQPRADYYDMVNAIRRAQGTNFTLTGSFAFVPMARDTLAWPREKLADWVRFKAADTVCGTIPKLPNGKYAHGTALPQADVSLARDVLKAFQDAAPGARTMMYYHTFISTEEGAREKYAADAVRDAAGRQADYGQGIYPLFFPTLENAYGRAMRENVEILLGKIGAGGVYWDEMEYSRFAYTYGEPWDGVSADVDPKTLTIARRKSSVTLLTQPFKASIARERLLERGVPLIANGQPRTWTMTQLHFPRFVETGAITHLASAQLYSPIGLGDHLTERAERDVARQIAAHLDFGCLYYWYSGQIAPTHPNLTAFTFPFTPLELREGTAIGKERILTNRSGLFGWGDAARHEVHVFDREGRETTRFPARAVTRDGQTFTELRMPKGYTAAILRVPAR